MESRIKKPYVIYLAEIIYLNIADIKKKKFRYFKYRCCGRFYRNKNL